MKFNNRITIPTNISIKTRTRIVIDPKIKVRRNIRTIKISTKTSIEKR